MPTKKSNKKAPSNKINMLTVALMCLAFVLVGVFLVVQSFDQTFNMYKDVNSDMPDWAVSKAGRTPAGAPFHEGAIRYLKEKGIWTVEDDQWNDKFLARMKKVQELWKVTLQEIKSKGIAEKDFTEYWLNKRMEIKD